MANTITSNSVGSSSVELPADDNPSVDNSVDKDVSRTTGSALAAFSGVEPAQANDVSRAANDILSDPTQLAALLSQSLDRL